MKIVASISLSLVLIGCATQPSNNNIPTDLKIDSVLLEECTGPKEKLETPDEKDVLQLIKELVLSNTECRERQKASVIILKKLANRSTDSTNLK
jgi:hypothetical protein